MYEIFISVNNENFMTEKKDKLINLSKACDLIFQVSYGLNNINMWTWGELYSRLEEHG